MLRKRLPTYRFWKPDTF